MPAPTPTATTNRFTFGAGGDHGSGSRMTRSLNSIDASDIEFYLAAGDMSYGGMGSETAWCQYVKDNLPTKQAQYSDQFPFQLVTGNHEDDGPDGLIRNFAACLPDRLGVTGDYGVQYYFDYPSGGPLARFIAIAPDLAVDGHYYQYNTGGAGSDRQWLIDAIRGAPTGAWVIVFEHRNCISLGTKGCQIGEATMDLLIGEGVDLLIQGHEHLYERSHSLSCADVGVFLPACVADDGGDGQYAADAGTIFHIIGTPGRGFRSLSFSDPEKGYFTSWNGDNGCQPLPCTNNTGGWSRYEVTPTAITFTYISTDPVGGYSDTFTITR